MINIDSLRREEGYNGILFCMGVYFPVIAVDLPEGIPLSYIFGEKNARYWTASTVVQIDSLGRQLIEQSPGQEEIDYINNLRIELAQGLHSMGTEYELETGEVKWIESK